jgi:hypothetical protein
VLSKITSTDAEVTACPAPSCAVMELACLQCVPNLFPSDSLFIKTYVEQRLALLTVGCGKGIAQHESNG